MKNRIFICLNLLLMVSFMGCADFLDINTSKDAPTTVTVDQALPPICFYAAQIVYDHAEYGVYLSQALTTASKSETGSYGYSQGWEFLQMNRHPQWRRHFYDLGANINQMELAAKKIDSKNFILIGRTIRLQSTLITTDVFGEMPRKNAYLATSPTYDSQEEIFEWLFQEADELVALYSNPEWVNNPNNIPISAKMDRIYKGDMKKWAAYTKALRARLWLRKLPNWDNTPEVCNKIIAMVDEVLNDPNWEEPRYNYPGGTTEQNCPWGPARPIINAWESRDNRLVSSMPTKFFGYAILGAYASANANRRFALDPRAEKIMCPRDMSGNAGGPSGTCALRYLESNIGMDVSMRANYYPDLYADQNTTGNNPFTRNKGYIALMTHEELLFTKAEAQYWAGDKAGAYNTTMTAVLHNMVRYGVTTADGSELTGQFKTRFDRYFEVRLPGESKFTIANLMQQKYVAMYLQAEQWNDMRRYNYSSRTNGIKYDNVEVYTVKGIHRGGTSTTYALEEFTQDYALRRPYNLYEPYWMQADAFGINAELSPNAWLARLNVDPDTEDRYNRAELERLGAYKNHNWLKKRVIWARKNNDKVTCSDPNIEWK